MDRAALITALRHHHGAFLAQLAALPAAALEHAPTGKWNPVQHLDHIARGVRGVVLGLRLPPWLLRLWMGRPRRAGRDYAGLVQRYRERLAQGGRARGVFVPPPRSAGERERFSEVLQKRVEQLCTQLEGWTEEELDNTLMPHPLLGKLTVREMLYFTIYHVQHHAALVERDRLHT